MIFPNPQSLGIKALVAVIALGVAYGAGYAIASHGAIKTVAQVATTAGTVAAKAQSDHDKGEHNAASTKSASVKAEDKKHDDKTTPILQAIITASTGPKNSCDVDVAVLQLLNEAGHY